MPETGEEPTFFGVPGHVTADARAVLFGVPAAFGTPNSGAENGPFFIRRLSKYYKSRFGGEADLLDLRARGPVLEGAVDGGDIGHAGSPAELHSRIGAFVAGLPEQSVPIAVGGDHSITAPLVAAVHGRRPIARAVFLDHHLDVQCWGEELDPLYHTNVASHVAGMLGPGRVTHIGVEPFQGAEVGRGGALRSRLDELGRQLPLHGPDGFGAAAVAEAVGTGQEVYLSVDLDVLAAHEMSATGYPSWDGLRFTELVGVIETIARHNTITGCDIVEFAAARDARDPSTLADAGRAAKLLMHLTQVVLTT
jgi:arginase family enzyme